MKQLIASPSLQLVTYPASATAQSAEFASADCVTGLNEIGQISVSNISGGSAGRGTYRGVKGR